MHRSLKIAIGALAPIAVAAGCGGYITDPKAINNPNFPTSVTSSQLLVGTQVALTSQYTGNLARIITMWMRQFAGTDRQFTSLGLFVYAEDSFSGDWNQVYTGGGLVDIRRLEAQVDAAGDKLFGGIARVEDALASGFAADLWGDIPYSEALLAAKPANLTPQLQVYASIQAKLDTAVTMLSAGTGTGPGANDLFYGGSGTKWLRLAHTLKARNYLHVAEVDPTAYAKALAEAKQGLQKGDDFTSYQSSGNPNEWNLWYQFTVVQRAGYISPDAYFINLLKSRNDPRLTVYFAPATAGGPINGANPGTGGGTPPGVAELNPEGPGNPGYRQPIVTWAENQLIIAETAFRAGDLATALAAYNAERAAAGFTTTATTLTLQEIMTEKYIALFQNIEVWNDYKRTCLPPIPSAVPGTPIPERILYPTSELDTNPNIPPATSQKATNANDPNACPAR